MAPGSGVVLAASKVSITGDRLMKLSLAIAFASLIPTLLVSQAADQRIQIRPGLLEALQRRASFTRSHRGPFASPTTGDTADSSPTPAAWHAGDRVLFAWHQHDQIIFAAFDPRGQTLVSPQAIGSGRWPTLTVDGDRAAVCWRRANRLYVRIYQAKKWST